MSLEIHGVDPPLQSSGRKFETRVRLIVMHSTAKPEASDERAGHAVEVLRRRGLSYHYIISKSGAVFQCVSPELKAHHAGSSYGPLEEAAGISKAQRADFTFEAGTSVNEYSIGISFVNLDKGFDPFTEAQTGSAIALIQYLQGQACELAWLTSHAEVSPGRKVDPLGYELSPLASAVGLKRWPG